MHRLLNIDSPLAVMMCHLPKTIVTKTMEDMELKFRIESKPVVGLLLLLALNGVLYLAIMPFAVRVIVYMCK